MSVNTIIGLLLLAATSMPQAAPRVGQPAPEFAGVDTSDQAHSLSAYRGKVVVLEWTNHDCPYVRKHYGAGNMQALQRTAQAGGVVWLSIISSAPGKQGHVTPTEADRLTAQRDAAPRAVILDSTGAIGRTYGAKTTPHMFIVDQDGTLVYMGGIDSIPTANPADIPRARPFVQVALDQLLRGEPVGEPVTRPYGCSVKY